MGHFNIFGIEVVELELQHLSWIKDIHITLSRSRLGHDHSAEAVCSSIGPANEREVTGCMTGGQFARTHACPAQAQFVGLGLPETSHDTAAVYRAGADHLRSLPRLFSTFYSKFD